MDTGLIKVFIFLGKKFCFLMVFCQDSTASVRHSFVNLSFNPMPCPLPWVAHTMLQKLQTEEGSFRCHLSTFNNDNNNTLF